MLYLEDYLETIEHLPHELRDRFTSMRILDLQVNNEMDAVDDKVKQFFTNAKKMKPDQRDVEFQKLQKEYSKIIEEADEKVELASQIYDLVEKYLKRLDSELQKFKIELEVDNSGITEMLERRSLELDHPSIPALNNNIRDKRKHSYNDSNLSHSGRDGSGTNSYLPLSNSNWMNSNSMTNSISNMINNSNANTNGNPLLANTLNSPNSPSFYTLGAGSTAIAAAASQAIAATQQMQQGRRTASLKASYEAINGGLHSLNCDFSALREGSISSVNSQGGSFNSGEGSSTGLYKATKRSRSSSQYIDTEESSDAMAMDENGVAVDWNPDASEERYCLCNQVSYGEMVACDNNTDCQYGHWFHFGCVGITQPPKGKWYCPPCTQQLKKRKKDKS
ncbi:inhibitor of growth family, member 3 isoform X1 [Brevipalpus obovatus]|uniref:inhibitor of growth family, member 3 isoform X1 n=1 Tax=Brevipalpus obovatus TaxID=246614 RepID=UPI003D9E15A7